MNFNRPLITGGAGFIGSHLVNYLISIGIDSLTVLDNLSKGNCSNLDDDIDRVVFKEIDITDFDWLDFLSNSNFDCIFQFAGNADVQNSVDNPDFDYKLNLHATFSLIEAIRKLRWPGRLVFSSSAAVYGNPLKLPVSESDPAYPISPYGVSKLAVERYISVYCQSYDIRACSLRTASVYGPRLHKQVVFDIFRKISLNPETINIYGDGSQTRDFIFVQDVARAAVAIANNAQLKGEVYNVASGRSYSIIQLIKMISRSLGKDPEIKSTGDLRIGDPVFWEFDIKKLENLGFKPKFSLDQGISITKEWYSKEYVK